MVEIAKILRVTNQKGLHARPAQKLVRTILNYKCDTYITLNGYRVNAKSIMGVLTLAATQGTDLTVTCAGEDAAEAMAALEKLFKTGFKDE
ncbi:MAG: HPr family phosphocarrier protein [Candidatus Hydrogenedentes bacterium]|nr:HPr family phosphocarrier protein [Candidatus Hydrogenedentota bacterium]